MHIQQNYQPGKPRTLPPAPSGQPEGPKPPEMPRETFAEALTDKSSIASGIFGGLLFGGMAAAGAAGVFTDPNGLHPFDLDNNLVLLASGGASAGMLGCQALTAFSNWKELNPNGRGLALSGTLLWPLATTFLSAGAVVAGVEMGVGGVVAAALVGAGLGACFTANTRSMPTE